MGLSRSRRFPPHKGGSPSDSWLTTQNMKEPGRARCPSLVVQSFSLFEKKKDKVMVCHPPMWWFDGDILGSCQTQVDLGFSPRLATPLTWCCLVRCPIDPECVRGSSRSRVPSREREVPVIPGPTQNMEDFVRKASGAWASSHVSNKA